MVRGVYFQLRRASYREKGKSGATFKILSYFPNTDETWPKGPATTAAKRRRRRTSPLPQAPGPGVPTACSSQGRPRPRCHHLLPPSERSCPIWLWMPYAPVSKGSSLLLRRNRDLGRSSSVVTCHRSAATDREAGGVCRALITCRCLALQRRPAGGSPAVVRSPRGVDLQRREGSPCGCGGRPCRCTRMPGCPGRPVTGSHSHPWKRNFPIDSPSKGVCLSVGRSAQPPCQNV